MLTLPDVCLYFGENVECKIDVFIMVSGLVIEAAPSGLASGRAAGCKTVAVCSSHTAQAIQESGVNPDYVVKDLTRYVLTWLLDSIQHDEPALTSHAFDSISAKWVGDSIEVTINTDA